MKFRILPDRHNPVWLIGASSAWMASAANIPLWTELRHLNLLATPAGDLGMTMPMSLIPTRGDSHHLYLEVASTTVALILAGRWFEARSKRRAGSALRALLALGAEAAQVLQADGRALGRAVSALPVSDSLGV